MLIVDLVLTVEDLLVLPPLFLLHSIQLLFSCDIVPTLVVQLIMLLLWLLFPSVAADSSISRSCFLSPLADSRDLLRPTSSCNQSTLPDHPTKSP